MTFVFSLVKTIGQESLYHDSWIEELCWTTKNTLALCNARANSPTDKENATVSLLHLESGTNVNYLFLPLLRLYLMFF